MTWRHAIKTVFNPYNMIMLVFFLGIGFFGWFTILIMTTNLEVAGEIGKSITRDVRSEDAITRINNRLKKIDVYKKEHTHVYHNGKPKYKKEY